MSGKRPFQNNNNTDQQISKKQRPNSDFKAPPARSNSNVNPNWPQPSQNPPKVPPNSIKQSIADREDIFDEDDDEVFLIASQRADENERRMNLKRQMMSEELNFTYGAFVNNAAGSSTQHLAVNAKSVVTSNGLKQDEKFTYLAQAPNAAQQSPAQQAARSEGTGSSQKENLSAQQLQAKRIRALEIQLANLKTRKSDLEERLMMKEGESSNLRRDKKALEDQLRLLKMQKLQDADLTKDDPEKIRLRKEVSKLQANLNFTNLNTTFSRDNGAQADVTTLVPHFTNFPIKSQMEPLAISGQTFYPDVTPIKTIVEPLKVRMEREASFNVTQCQLSLAEVNSVLAHGKTMDEAHMSSLFGEISDTIVQVCHYIEYLTAGHEREPKHNLDPALNAFLFLNIPCTREKLTRIDAVYNFLDENDGCETIYQSDRMFHEEICSKPRRIIACIAILAKHLGKFSEKLLLENLEDDGEIGHRTLVSLLVDTVGSKIACSDKVHDFFGFTLACSTFLAGLGRHYSTYPCSGSIDTVLARFLRVILECQCDSPLVMLQLSEFLVQVTRDKAKNQLTHLLCRDFPIKNIENSRKFKYCQYPDEACTFQLFLMYLLTAFSANQQLNRLELKLLFKITMNLNRIALNIQAMPADTIRCLVRDKDEETTECCGCITMLTSAMVTLNHLAQRHREAFQAFPPFENKLLNDSIVFHSNKHHAWLGELARGYISVQSDLFERISVVLSQAYPLPIWFSNYNEQLCFWMKHGETLHNNEMLPLPKAYETEILAESLKNIEISPTFDTSRQPSDEQTEPSDADNEKVKSLTDQLSAEISNKSFN